ncbi:tetratricopeptide repeat protein [Kibdelosporangium aridum]|uniref:Tetratricopeptide repeat protein n=1 Tax=Kibdelosporangium aridum TaxID=2030 RepID=A0A428Z385_KIBAR|nr:tetratricopeptide repeat protein [Kibdelosporangium aridum]RSM80393.1 tetratricopeptide repeat protein [Kibdelosporangium aridum]
MLDPIAEARRRLGLARRFYDEGRAEEAVVVAETALAVVEHAGSPNHPAIAGACIELSLLHERLSQYIKAERYARRAIVITEEYSRNDETLVRLRVKALGCLAMVERVRNRFGSAEVLYKSALDLAENGTWPHPEELAELMCGLGAVYLFSSRFDEAETLYRQALDLVGAEKPSSAVVWHHMAELDLMLSRFITGESYARRALALRERALGPDHAATANERAMLAAVLARQGNLDLAEKLYRKAISTFERVLPPNHYDLAVACADFGMLMAAKGNMAAAGRLAQRALDIKTKILGRSHPEVLQAVEDLARYN